MESVIGVKEEPLSPNGLLFHSSDFNCCIIAVIGFRTKLDPSVIIQGFSHSFVKHPRFSSKLVIDHEDRKKLSWIKTEVNVEDHVTVPDIDPDMEYPDEFVEDYVSNLSTIPLDISKPLWDIHILNVKTSDSESQAILRIHHSIGDGMSIMSLVFACTRKTSDDMSVPGLITARARKSQVASGGSCRVWSGMRLVLNSFVDVFKFVATTGFLSDTETAIKGKPGVEHNPKRFVHKIVKMDDVKLVKDVMNMTVNDVLLGVLEAGLTRYLRRRYDAESVWKPSHHKNHVRLRGTIFFNLRPNVGIQALADMMEKGSKCKWGNEIGYVLLPLSIATETDPLNYVRRAKATIDRKKHSLEAIFSFAAYKCLFKVFGPQKSAKSVNKIFSNTTLTFSNLAGPAEEISFYGHPISYIAPTVYGHPHALTVHFQSYVNKMVISLAVDPTVIPDPHQLCDDLDESFKNITAAALERRFKPKDN